MLIRGNLYVPLVNRLYKQPLTIGLTQPLDGVLPVPTPAAVRESYVQTTKKNLFHY